MIQEDERLSTEPIEQRIRIAKKQCENLTNELTRMQTKLDRWKTYLESLLRVQESEQELYVSPSNGHVQISVETRQKRSVAEMIVYYGYQQPEYELANKAVVEWLVNEHIYSDKRSALAGASSTLSHRHELFRNIKRGRYVLTSRAIELGAIFSDAEKRQFNPLPK